MNNNNYKKRSNILGLLLTVTSVLLAVCILLLYRIRRDIPIIEAIGDIRAYAYNLEDDLKQKTLADRALRGIVSALDDPYAKYYTKDEYEQLTNAQSGKYVGIGVLIRQPDEIGTMIETVYFGGAVEKAGGMAGDYILAVDGKKTANLSMVEVLSMFDFEAKKTYELTLGREGNEFSVVVDCSEISVPYAQYRMETDEIGYISISAFYGNVTEETDSAVRALEEQGMRALILDLRDNPGGNLKDAVGVAELFLKPGDPIVTVRARDNKEERYRSEKNGTDVPVAVLVNAGTASAAELLTGALRDNGRAVVIGNKTYGKGVVQSVIPLLSNGGYLKVTTDVYFTPAEVCLQGNGIEPDLMTDGGENELFAAVETLQKTLTDMSGEHGETF